MGESAESSDSHTVWLDSSQSSSFQAVNATASFNGSTQYATLPGLQQVFVRMQPHSDTVGYPQDGIGYQTVYLSGSAVDGFERISPEVDYSSTANDEGLAASLQALDQKQQYIQVGYLSTFLLLLQPFYADYMMLILCLSECRMVQMWPPGVASNSNKIRWIIVKSQLFLRFQDFAIQAHTKLFRALQNKEHCLHQLLPSKRSNYSLNLRKRGHEYRLPEWKTELHKCSFINRCLYKFV